jgi:hypothetical protein
MKWYRALLLLSASVGPAVAAPAPAPRSPGSACSCSELRRLLGERGICVQSIECVGPCQWRLTLVFNGGSVVKTAFAEDERRALRAVVVAGTNASGLKKETEKGQVFNFFMGFTR